MKILIVGGGIGGLTAALCCLHHGHDVMVFEQASTLEPVGAGLQIPPNAMKVFAALNIDDAIVQKAFLPPAIKMRMGKNGMNLLTVELGNRATTIWGARYCHTHRADCISVLEQAASQLAPGAIHLGAQVTACQQNNDGVQVKLADGQVWHGDILIGADGIRSFIRAQIFKSKGIVFSGITAWRTVVPVARLGVDAPEPSACVWVGPGRHAVTYRVRGGTLVNFVGVVEQGGQHAESWQTQGSRDEALNDFSGWHPSIIRIIEESTTLFRWGLFERPALPAWSQNRITLLGDAAHPMLPSMAQGAAMAIEDAWTLAVELSVPGRDPALSLRACHKRRYKRVGRVQTQSRANMKLFHQKTPFSQLAGYGPIWLANKLAPGLAEKQLNWLYGHDVTAP